MSPENGGSERFERVNGTCERLALIRCYIEQAFSYIEIVATMLIVHGVSISLRQLKRLLSRAGLKIREFSRRRITFAFVD